ncbi:hypothetical protein [Bacterioplanoides sp. SCSIO 12839]|uniref:hypothetical protein n=1 Tax=Bacterioplanoides sp. SCSIO 12839 TaxID=2829569 RepID=UPI0021084A32|nr:hypothetical protein [Bacterioplanoides sp. SCSIO 12839]UTW49960.1 hypothetical protein KFF03_08780 [Bacterioplanoides sp. SCSIO 12839]
MSALLRCVALLGLLIVFPSAAHDLTPCQEKRKAVLEVVNKGTPSASWNKELVTLAKSSAINSECNHWQYNILYALSGSQYPTADYRRWLFAQLDVVAPQELDTLIPKTLDFVFADQQQGQPIKPEEWKRVVEAVVRMPAKDIASVPVALSRHTEQRPNKNNEKQVKQSAKTLVLQLNELSNLVDSERLGTPSLNNNEWLRVMLKAIAVRQPELMADYYLQRGAQLEAPLYLLKPITRYYRYIIKNNRDELLPGAEQALIQLFEQLSLNGKPLSANTESTLALLVRDFEEVAASRPEVQQKLDTMRERYAFLRE